ncbi:helix-turn-helix domain-containing protein [Paenibacillus thailandensis]|uniref:Helix-turn-helix domain-containing protein n=1 Tax=Paenibacillus thailandensis TaxID=393250 RepID=A0ABW5R3D4_9BACL
MITFKPLQHLLINRGLSKGEFIKLVDIAPSTASKMWKDEYIAMKIIDDICNKLDCKLTEVIEHIPENKPNEEQH